MAVIAAALLEWLTGTAVSLDLLLEKLYFLPSLSLSEADSVFLLADLVYLAEEPFLEIIFFLVGTPGVKVALSWLDATKGSFLVHILLSDKLFLALIIYPDGFFDELALLPLISDCYSSLSILFDF